MTSNGERFRPGTTIPTSGIYSAVHKGHAKEDHDVTCTRGCRFPPCRTCGESVEFVLVRKAKHVRHHELFSEVVLRSST